MNDTNDIDELLSKVAARLGAATPIELLRIEIKFLTTTLQSLLSGVVPFFEARQAFLKDELEKLLETLSKPRIVMPDEDML